MMNRGRLPARPGRLAVALLVILAAGATYQVQRGRASDARVQAAALQGEVDALRGKVVRLSWKIFWKRPETYARDQISTTTRKDFA